MSERIKLQSDGWAFGVTFFIQCALFEETSCANWKIKLEEGPHHNRTDGEIDYYVEAKRCTSLKFKDGIETRTYDVRKFRINANIYSYQSIFREALTAAAHPLERNEVIEKTVPSFSQG